MRNPPGVNATLLGRVGGHGRGRQGKSHPGFGSIPYLSVAWQCPHRDKGKKLHPTLQRGERRLGFPGAVASRQLPVGIL